VAENTPCRDRYSWPVSAFPGRIAPQAYWRRRNYTSPVAFVRRRDWSSRDC